VQGLGSPACAKLLTQWYPSSTRGTAWSIWTASNNVGGFAAPWIAGTAAGALGWRYGMWVPAACALAIASVIVFTITDKPTDKGFKPVEGPGSGDASTKSAPEPAKPAKKETKEEKDSKIKEIIFKDVLPNPYVWLFALSYFFVYLVRQGASTWFVHYLMNVKGVETLGAAAAQVSGLEIGGFCGALSAGAPLNKLARSPRSRPSLDTRCCNMHLEDAEGDVTNPARPRACNAHLQSHAGTLSDIFVRRAKKAGSSAGLVGVRCRVVLAYGVFTALALLAFSVVPNQPAIQGAAIALVGFGLYGPQMLIGLCGAEVRCASTFDGKDVRFYYAWLLTRRSAKLICAGATRSDRCVQSCQVAASLRCAHSAGRGHQAPHARRASRAGRAAGRGRRNAGPARLGELHGRRVRGRAPRVPRAAARLEHVLHGHDRVGRDRVRADRADGRAQVVQPAHRVRRAQALRSCLHLVACRRAACAWLRAGWACSTLEPRSLIGDDFSDEQGLWQS
jgi:Major Facilitator Superfamily